MPLHDKSSVREALDDDIYSSADLSAALPKYRFPADEHAPRHVYALIHDELMLDGSSRQNLATFCQTWLEPEVRDLMRQCIDKNMIDKDEYPQTAEIEARCVHMLADLWNAPHAADTVGCSTTGSSEAAMLGGLAMRSRWRAARGAAGKPCDRPNLVTGPVQICWHKFARYWDIELREIPMEPGRLTMTPEEATRRCDCAPELQWDFRLPRVKSINASGHKFGLAPLGVGWVMWRENKDLPEDLVFWVNYLGGNMRDLALNFSRPGGQVVCQYYNFLRLGKEGYRKIHGACYRTAQYLAAELEEMGLFEILYGGDPNAGIPALCWRLKDDSDPGFTLYDLADRLRSRGWQVPAYALPPRQDGVVVQRILVRHGVSRDLASLLLDDIKRAIDHLKRHPVHSPLSGEEASGFAH